MRNDAEGSDRHLPLIRGSLLLAIALSGVAGLMHEVIWTKLLRQLLGGSSLSLTTVLIAFLGGLAIGARLAARFVDRLRDPLRLLWILELAIAGWALLLPWLIEVSWPIWKLLYAGHPTPLFAISRLLGATLLLAPATLAMGATLPLLAASRRSAAVTGSRWIARLYAFNTIGAGLGALLAGFWLLPHFGLSASVRGAAFINVVAALIFWCGWCVVRRRRDPAAGERGQPAVMVAALRWGYLLAASALLLHELVWARVASLLIGSTVYAYSLLLSAVILGLGLGGFVARPFLLTVRSARRTLVVTQLLIALSALTTLLFVDRVPYWITARFADSAAGGGAGWGLMIGLIASATLLPAILMGMSYPLACRWLVGADSNGRTAARMQSWGNVAAVAGAAVGGLWLLPAFGIQRTGLIAVSMNVVAAAIFYSRRRSALWIGGAIALSITLCLLLPSWQPAAISLGPFVQARRQPAEISAAPRALREWNDRQEVLFHRDGREASYTVKQTPDGERSLWINGKPDASSSADLPTQRLLGQLPLILAADRESALVIGVASGSTLHSMATHPLQRIEAVERSLMTRELASWFFDVNGGVLDDPRLSLIEGDGRLHLSLTDRRYDVIVSEPSNPWIVGVGELYTREFFEIVRRRLSERGRFCLWLPAYHVDRPLFASVVASFTQTFPRTTLWHSQGSDYLLVGTLDAEAVPQGRIESRLSEPEVAHDLAQIGIHSSADLLASVVAGDEALRRFAAEAEAHTDDNGLLEYQASRRLLSNPDEAGLLMAIEQHRGESVPSVELDERASRYRRARGAAIRASLQLSSGATTEAIEALREAAGANPNDRFLEQTLASNQRHADQLAAAGRVDEARARYQLLLSISPQREATLEGWSKLQP